MSITTRIRIELLFGPLTPAELAKRMGRERSDLAPYLNQLCRAKKDPVIKVENKYVMRRAYTALQGWK